MLAINTRALTADTKFYIDQALGADKDGVPRAVYTLDVIPPEAVSIA